MAEKMSLKDVIPDDANYQELILPPKYCNMSEQECQEQLEVEESLFDRGAGINLIKQ